MPKKITCDCWDVNRIKEKRPELYRHWKQQFSKKKKIQFDHYI